MPLGIPQEKSPPRSNINVLEKELRRSPRIAKRPSDLCEVNIFIGYQLKKLTCLYKVFNWKTKTDLNPRTMQLSGWKVIFYEKLIQLQALKKSPLRSAPRKTAKRQIDFSSQVNDSMCVYYIDSEMSVQCVQVRNYTDLNPRELPWSSWICVSFY